MKKLYLMTAAAGILAALAGPTVAAQYSHRGQDAYAASNDRSGAYNYGPAYGSQAYGSAGYTPAQRQFDRAPVYGNAPYPDRPYGDPDRW